MRRELALNDSHIVYTRGLSTTERSDTMNDARDDSPPVERYYTYKEAAEILHITYDSLRTIVGRLQWERYRVRRRRHNLIPQSVIASYLQRRLRRCKPRLQELSR